MADSSSTPVAPVEDLLSAEEMVRRAARYLPSQGPITSFVHHNTLHAFEEKPFCTAVLEAAAMYGCQPYLSENRYREEVASGRIRTKDLRAVLIDELGSRAQESLIGLTPRIDLWFAMLHDPVRLASDIELQWVLEGSEALKRFRARCPSSVREQTIADTQEWFMRELREERENSGAARTLASDLLHRFGEHRIESWGASTWETVSVELLYRVCLRGVESIPELVSSPASFARPRDLLLAAGGEDTDLLVHDVLVRFCAAFIDQGMAQWDLPGRELGFYLAFLRHYQMPGMVRGRWLRGLRRELARLEKERIEPSRSVDESLAALGIPIGDRSKFVAKSLLALRGWAGMLWQLESRPEVVLRPVPPGTLLEYLAIRLILERFALGHIARDSLRIDVSLPELPNILLGRMRRVTGPTARQRAYMLFTLAQPLGWTPRRLSSLAQVGWAALLAEVEGFPELERRRVFHLAYERRYRMQTLDALAAHASRSREPTADGVRPDFQILCCLDEREESFRRHIEEVAPGFETFGVVGFFGVAMLYRGASDAHEMPLCPVSIRPTHHVSEVIVAGTQGSRVKGATRRRRLGRVLHRAHTGSRGPLLGMLAAMLGTVVALPLVLRVMFPRLSARLRARAGGLVHAEQASELTIIKASDSKSGHGADGFTIEEMAEIVENLLRDIGLTESFARLIVVVGHGSSSLNNPHEAAHDCGACGGGRGGPNARAYAKMANNSAVRELLVAKGLQLPQDTVFLGAYHNTCDDAVTFYDLESLPESHRIDFRWVRSKLQIARRRNAHERCRRFQLAPLSISLEDALRHVEARCEDLAQPRPEFGHATNAICLVGRRALSRSLFMDRRAFLVSYDPAADADDHEHRILARILEAVVPVCAGINLEYYFSYVDPTGWGCGTKLPHNITSLLGVMDGNASDLRTGLPWQMVEIHEPVRLLMVVESRPEALTGILERHSAIADLCHNEWFQLATIDPDSADLHVLSRGRFIPYDPESTDLPGVASSAAWYGGLREHLGYASINEPEGELSHAGVRR